ncbi:hypothetical protein AAY473_004531 [Plecturocebus cupreus]
MPAIPATREAEAGESLESRRRRLRGHIGVDAKPQERKRSLNLKPDTNASSQPKSCGITRHSTKHFQKGWSLPLNWFLLLATAFQLGFGESPYSFKIMVPTLGGRGGWITRSRDRDHPGQHGETPSLLKYKKLAGRGGFLRVHEATSPIVFQGIDYAQKYRDIWAGTVAHTCNSSTLGGGRWIT